MSRYTIAIDPGYARRGRGCAVAVFRGGVLASVAFARPGAVTLDDLVFVGHSDVARVVWEIPQVDARTRVSVPAVVRLAAEGGVLAGLYAAANGGVDVVAVAPSAWKGSAPKPVCHGRAWAVLRDSERVLLGGDATAARIDAAKRAGGLARWRDAGATYYGAWTGHNLLDAAAIGLWAEGRMRP